MIAQKCGRAGLESKIDLGLSLVASCIEMRGGSGREKQSDVLQNFLAARSINMKAPDEDICHWET
jgi:hypothetical protein